MKTISNKIIRRMDPCYDPAKVVKDENEELPVKEWVAKYRELVRDKSDIIWLLCNKLYMSEKDMRLFAVWCAREALKLIDNPDPRSVEACNVAERYANGDATIGELAAASKAASKAAFHADSNITWDVAWAAWAAAANAASDADWTATSNTCLAAATNTARAVANVASEADSATKEADWDAARSATWDAQIDRLMTYF